MNNSGYGETVTTKFNTTKKYKPYENKFLG